MKKISRRTAIKGIGAGIATSLAAPVSAASLAAGTDSRSDSLQVQIAHQWAGDSIVAVIKNKSAHAATITHINSVAADYGRFNFAGLIANGPLTLAPGEEVHVPFTPMATPVKPFGHFDNRLQKILRSSLTVSTSGDSLQLRTPVSPRVV